MDKSFEGRSAPEKKDEETRLSQEEAREINNVMSAELERSFEKEKYLDLIKNGLQGLASQQLKSKEAAILYEKIYRLYGWLQHGDEGPYGDDQEEVWDWLFPAMDISYAVALLEDSLPKSDETSLTAKEALGPEKIEELVVLDMRQGYSGIEKLIGQGLIKKEEAEKWKAIYNKIADRLEPQRPSSKGEIESTVAFQRF